MDDGAPDAWIGWSAPQRKHNLQSIVNQSRFLVLPWIQVKGLASKILSLVARRLPQDWHALYGYRPLLLETLVDRSRFSGTCYRAGNWIHLDATQRRGGTRIFQSLFEEFARLPQTHDGVGRIRLEVEGGCTSQNSSPQWQRSTTAPSP